MLVSIKRLYLVGDAQWDSFTSNSDNKLICLFQVHSHMAHIEWTLNCCCHKTYQVSDQLTYKNELLLELEQISLFANWNLNLFHIQLYTPYFSEDNYTKWQHFASDCIGLQKSKIPLILFQIFDDVMSTKKICGKILYSKFYLLYIFHLRGWAKPVS